MKENILTIWVAGVGILISYNLIPWQSFDGKGGWSYKSPYEGRYLLVF
jgi:hypothetical protein